MIFIGCDHGGYELKLSLIEHMEAKGVAFTDCGCDGETVDYPDIAKRVASRVEADDAGVGVLVCGTGIGVSIVANRFKGIRAALCGDAFSARHARLHNDANILCLGGRVIGRGLAEELLDIFLDTEFEGGRHAIRVSKFNEKEI